MIFKKNIFLEIDKNKTKKIDEKKEIEEIEKKSVNLLITGEKLFIKKFVFPRVNRNSMYFLVKNELNFSVGNITNILFDYKIISKLKSNIEILVFYINSQDISIIKKLKAVSSIKKIKIIQFEILDYYRNKIKEKSYLFMFLYNDLLYILAIKNNNLIANLLIESKELVEGNIDMFIINFKNNNSFSDVKSIYVANTKILDHKREICKGLNVILLQSYSKEKLFKIR